MKKLVSLILALVLALGCMTPAMAETADAVDAPVAPFTFAVTDFQTCFDLFVSSTELGITPVWTTSEDGLTVEADAQALGKVVLTLNADGQVIKVNSEAVLGLDNMEMGAYYFGVTVGLVTVAVKAAEDPTFPEDQANATQMEAELTSLVGTLTARINEVLTGTISESGVIAGHSATVYMRLDVINMSLIFGYTYEP